MSTDERPEPPQPQLTPAALLIDLSGCEFLGSSAMAVLIAAHHQTAATTTHLALSGMRPVVTRALHITGLDTLFDIYPATSNAVAALHNLRAVW